MVAVAEEGAKSSICQGEMGFRKRKKRGLIIYIWGIGRGRKGS